ncbi:MAG: glycerol-3-phosphate cytidylyltransferase [Elusimicrobia bacterium RIFCSPLOWO2_02_FULL_39_32]|nr:MAG: glycerol-3-phosphate cytidylyltransferase [Elusimicrobia bacterium RIFCSPHIGHO2_02_FULL_39_36]OGR92631.1 MAG: glycerol-3-phosphate cytidylyltransferase [Elusimicrobia bacterium RIFCSPLOWO2_02_FULL_39_32]OGR99277.1 MAG: glycerol-3-phosphate cytidylyltransferase [Elusimicrobia bacterium RIFCSPLOWO2_12_FULL_39_28]
MKTKIVSRNRLAKILQKEKNKKKIVFTNGCFDLLHLGHLRLLQGAKKCGDILVVALNSDESVRRIKGPLRPLVNERARAELIAALEIVDYVTFFSEETPEKTIQLLKPDILVKGSDYPLEQIVGRNHVLKVARIPLIQGYSTSSLVTKIIKSYGRSSNNAQ